VIGKKIKTEKKLKINERIIKSKVTWEKLA